MNKTFFFLLIIIGCAGSGEIQRQEAEAECSEKSCWQMTSCAEALYNFQYCGRKELDHDEDGQPCETVCKEL